MTKMYKIGWEVLENDDLSNHGTTIVKLPECVVEAYLFDGTHHEGISNTIANKLLENNELRRSATFKNNLDVLKDFIKNNKLSVQIADIYEQGRPLEIW